MHNQFLKAESLPGAAFFNLRRKSEDKKWGESSNNRRWPEEFDQVQVAGVGFLSWFYLWSDTDQMIVAWNTPWSLEIEKFSKTCKKKFLAFFFICDRNHRFFWSLPTIPMIRRIFYRFSQIFHRFFTDFSDFGSEEHGSAATDCVTDQMIFARNVLPDL